MKSTIATLQKLKGKRKITSITAYDALFGSIFDGEVDLILVGDSLSMSFAGNDDTIPITIDEMIYHAKAVRKGVKDTLLVADMPFGSYNTIDEALHNASRFYKESQSDAIKIEVNPSKLPIVRELVNNGIAVMAHIGLMPQFYRFEGGYKIKGRDEKESRELVKLAIDLEQCGCFALLLEGIKSNIAEEITSQVQIPTIGIGSGVHTDGQILVWSDAFGFFDKFSPKFVRRYLNGKDLLKNALRQYTSDIINEKFPNEAESY